MKDESLYVKLPARLKEALLKRFDLRRAQFSPKTRMWMIYGPCPVCELYEDCRDCPFGRFRSSREGCLDWLRHISDWPNPAVDIFHDYIAWSDDDNETARRVIRSIRQAIKKYIIATPEEG